MAVRAAHTGSASAHTGRRAAHIEDRRELACLRYGRIARRRFPSAFICWTWGEARGRSWPGRRADVAARADEQPRGSGRLLGRPLLERGKLTVIGLDFHAIDICRARAVPRPRDHHCDSVRVTLNQGFDVPIEAIAHPAPNAERGGPATHRVTKAHALHATDDDQATSERLHDGSTLLGCGDYIDRASVACFALPPALRVCYDRCKHLHRTVLARERSGLVNTDPQPSHS
jgi:hypothetical protein